MQSSVVARAVPAGNSTSKENAMPSAQKPRKGKRILDKRVFQVIAGCGMLLMLGAIFCVLHITKPTSIQVFSKPSFSSCGYAGAGSCYPPLTSKMFWDPEQTKPFSVILAKIRENLPTIKDEINAFRRSFDHDKVQHKSSAKKGWMTTMVWSATEGWRENSCKSIPTLCKIMPAFLPTVSNLMLDEDQEEFEIFGMAPMGHLQKHHDSCGPRLGMLICVIGCEGFAWHRVYEPDQQKSETRMFKHEGDAIMFDPNYKHEAGSNSPDKERWIISLQLSHPEFSEKYDQICHGCHPYSTLHQNKLWSLKNAETELQEHPIGQHPRDCGSWWKGSWIYDYCYYCKKEGQTTCNVHDRDKANAATRGEILR